MLGMIAALGKRNENPNRAVSASPPRRRYPLPAQGARAVFSNRGASPCERPPGSDLFSHTLASAVSSALRRFTSVFGMGTGGSVSLEPPKDYGNEYSRHDSRCQIRFWGRENRKIFHIQPRPISPQILILTRARRRYAPANESNGVPKPHFGPLAPFGQPRAH